MIEYSDTASGQTILLLDDVMMQFSRYRQTRWYHREAGGQLFARFEGSRIEVVEATGPRCADIRRLRLFLPNRKAEQEEIDSRHSRDLHYVGDWHTHPQERPQASTTDLESIGDCYRRSSHSLGAFLLVVVGRDNAPAGIQVWVHDGKQPRELPPGEEHAPH